MVSTAEAANETTGKQMNEAQMNEAPVKLDVRDVSIYYGDAPAIEHVTLDVREHEIFGIIGPANAGKTSFLKAINRMDMFTSNMKVKGDIFFSGYDIRKARNIYALRSRIGVVFPLPVGLPMTIYNNVALAPSVQSRKSMNLFG